MYTHKALLIMIKPLAAVSLFVSLMLVHTDASYAAETTSKQPKPACSGHSCSGLDPEFTKCNKLQAHTIAWTESYSPKFRVELRYSPVCDAFWTLATFPKNTQNDYSLLTTTSLIVNGYDDPFFNQTELISAAKSHKHRHVRSKMIGNTFHGTLAAQVSVQPVGKSGQIVPAVVFVYNTTAIETPLYNSFLSAN